MLGTTFALRLIGTVIALVTAVVIIGLVRPGDTLLRLLVAILSATTVIQIFDVVALWFQAQVESKYIVWARRIASLATALVQIALILVAAPLVAFVWAALVESAIASIGFVFFYARTPESFRRWRVNWRLAVDLLRDSWPLIISGLAVGIYMRIDKIMLGEMVGDGAVGMYEAAVRVSELWYFLPVAMASTVFPLIVRARQKQNAQAYQERVQLFFDVMLGMSYLIVIPLTFVAQPIVLLLFGESYRGAASILQIHIWAMVFVTLGIAQSQWLVVENLVQFSMWTTVLGAVANIALNLWLIPLHAGIGAAWATVIAYAVSAYFSCLILPRLRVTFRQLTLSILLPFRLRGSWHLFQTILLSSEQPEQL